MTPLYHFHLLHRHLDISLAITAESSPLHIAGSRARTGTCGFRAQVANHQAALFFLEIGHRLMEIFLMLKRLVDNLTSPVVFLENVSAKEIVNSWFFVTFNIIISHIFPENSIEIPQVVQKI